MSAAGRLWAWALAATSGVACAALYAIATGTAAGRDLDARILVNADRPYDVTAHVVVHIVNPVTAVAALVGILWFAAVRRGRATAVALGIALVAANASAALLKTLLGESDPVGGESARHLGAGFYPSGHMTAAMSVVLAVVVLVGPGPARARAALAGGLAAGAVGVANVIAQTHHASDVVGAFLLATAWMGLTYATLPTTSRSERRRMVAAAAGACSIALTLVVVVAALE